MPNRDADRVVSVTIDQSKPARAHPLLALYFEGAPPSGVSPVVGVLDVGGRRLEVWVHYVATAARASGEATAIPSTRLARRLPGGSQSGTSHQGLLHLPWQAVASVYAADVDDLLRLDEVTVESDEPLPLGSDDWLLMSSPQLTAPVRVHAIRAANGRGLRIRLGYQTRTIWKVKRLETVGLSLAPPRLRKTGHDPRPWLDPLFEWVIGAPEIPLRSTEAVIGDDGERIVRADRSVLDRLGVTPGADVRLAWLDRTLIVRMVETDDGMWDRMRKQLAATGQQVVLSTSAVPEIIEHLTIWVPAQLRAELGAPTDSVVRVRRSAWAVVRSQLYQLTIPVTGLIVAALAVPDVSQWWWALALIVVLTLSLIPLRIGRRS